MTTKKEKLATPAEKREAAAAERHAARVALAIDCGFNAQESDILADAVALDTGLETLKEKQKKGKEALRSSLLELRDKHDWAVIDLDSGGRGGKERPVGRLYRPLCDLVAGMTLNKGDLALYLNGDGKRGGDAAKIRNRVAGTARRFAAILSPSEAKALDEVLRDTLANARTKVFNAQKADTDKREQALADLAGHDGAWLALLDAAIAAAPKK